MTPVGGAAAQLARLLYLLPAAARQSMTVAEAAERLGVDEQTIIDDLATVTEREFYHPAGGAEDLRVEIDGEEIRVHSYEKFRRPPRLGPRESLAAYLALRRRAADLDAAGSAAALDLAERIAADLATADPEEARDQFALEEHDEGGDVRGLLRRAASERLRCRMSYLRGADGELSERTLDPYELVASRGSWYVVGYCGLREDVRLFRLDRILEIELTDGSFEVPDDFDALAWVDDGRVFQASDVDSVVVEYHGLAAGLIAERGPVEPVDGDRVRVRYEVADPGWVVAHVLAQSGEAEVVAPDKIRALVAQVAGRIADGASRRLEELATDT